MAQPVWATITALSARHRKGSTSSTSKERHLPTQRVSPFQFPQLLQSPPKLKLYRGQKT